MKMNAGAVISISYPRTTGQRVFVASSNYSKRPGRPGTQPVVHSSLSTGQSEQPQQAALQGCRLWASMELKISTTGLSEIGLHLSDGKLHRSGADWRNSLQIRSSTAVTVTSQLRIPSLTPSHKFPNPFHCNNYRRESTFERCRSLSGPLQHHFAKYSLINALPPP
jgi:hypothetical protein